VALFALFYYLRFTARLRRASLHGLAKRREFRLRPVDLQPVGRFRQRSTMQQAPGLLVVRHRPSFQFQ
jgi:hypothetical protein